MMKRLIKHGLTIFVALLILVSSVSVFCFAETVSLNGISNENANDIQSEYVTYITPFLSSPKASQECLAEGSAMVSNNASGTFVEEEGNVLFWNGKGSITWNIDITTDALYTFRMIYSSPKTGIDLKMSISIDGQKMFSDMDKLYFPKLWVDSEESIRNDQKGNELAAEQIQVTDFITQDAVDDTGVVVDPFLFHLTAGNHSVTIHNLGQEIRIAKIGFGNPEVISSYDDVSKKYNLEENSADEIIYIQGEDASIKSSNELVPKADNTNAGMTPANAYIKKLNYIGGSAWESPTQSIEWKFYVEKSGYYRLGARYKQSEVINGESWRWLKIDGKTPFEEAKKLRFSYTPKWNFFEFSDSGEPYYLYLDQGEHTLSLTGTLGEISEFYEVFSDIVETLGDEYIKIVMITGENPDINRDYELFKQIVDFNKTLTSCRDQLLNLAEQLENFTGKRGSQYIAAIKNMVRVLKSMIDNPYNAQYYVKDYYTNYTSLSSWIYEMKSMPVSLDEIQLAPIGVDFEKNKSNVFNNVWFGIRRLANSFTADYNNTNTSSGSEYPEIRLWINWGRDQVSVLNSLIQDSFTPEHHINVKLEIVSASLINGILAGNFPDVSLHLARTEPLNLGIRGALSDLSQFEDCNEVLGRFQNGAEIPYRYNDKLYALPDTQSFLVMLYRTDVLENLNLDVPKTWDEFLRASTIIQRNNMQVYIPYTEITSTTTVNAGIGSLNLFPTLMIQNGLSLYNEQKNATALNSTKAVGVFEDWINFYKNYEFLKEASFYNRFRAGSMPIGIVSYLTYMSLSETAPEIEGRWSIACVPGTTDGNNSIAGSGTGCAIVKKSSHQKEAWEFLKWWTSAETQRRYSANVESIIGVISRTATANVEAFKNLAWDEEAKSVLLTQWSRVKEIPECPGSYYLSRAVDQAFWAVINDNENPQFAMAKWSEIADSEIARKIKEYS